MSKIGKKTISLPKDSSIKIEGGNLTVTGPKGSKTLTINDKIFSAKIGENNEFHLNPLKKPVDKNTSIMWGTYRSIVNNAVLGVTKGHEKILELSGVGFRANLKGDTLNLQLGFSHDINYKIPKEIKIAVEKQTIIKINGVDKEIVSKIAADIKSLKPVEPYKAKGIKEKNQSGSILPDSNLDTESKSISLEQVIFSGFKGINTFKKSELETQKANLKLKDMEQKTILEAASAYCDLIYKFKNEQFNISNVNLFERQVEFDNARLQKGEITLTDLAQSESSLAGANANLIKAKTELLSSITNFERVTREKIPEINELNQKIILDLPDTLNSALNLSNLNNIELLISKLDYEIAKRELSIEKSRFSPSASIKISKSENKDFSSTIDTKDDETVQATISWPLIKGGENVSSINKEPNFC